MHGSRPDLFQLRQLFLAAVIITGLVGIIAGVILYSADGFSQSAATVIVIGKMDVGSTPADFEFSRTGQGGPGQWTIVSDETSFEGRVIEQSSADRTDYRFPLAIFDPIVAKNVDVSLTFKPVAGARDFGSYERWRSEFIAIGKALAGGSGWVLLSWSPRDQKLINQWAADHCHTLTGGTPILALDMYEHSYHIDFGAKAATYVDTFMAAIRWKNTDQLFTEVSERGGAHSRD
jgi:hypothetical protein